MGVRVALGAEPARLIRQLYDRERAARGDRRRAGYSDRLLGARRAVRASRQSSAAGRSAHIDGRVLAFTVVVALISAIGFGLTPALHAASADLQTALRPAGRGTTPGGRKWADALVGIQVALAMLLLVASLLLMGSFARLSRVNVGFDVANVLTVPLDLPEHQYPEARQQAFFQDALARLASLPGVESVAATATNPFRQWGFANDVTPEDRAADAPPSGFTQAGWRSVTPEFFQLLRVPMQSGRSFTADDRDGAPGVVIVSQSLANKLWPTSSALGRRVVPGRRRGTDSNRRRRGRRHSRREARCRSDADALSAVRAAAAEGHDAARQDARNCGRYAVRGSPRDSGP